MSYWVNLDFKVPLHEIELALEEVCNFHRPDIYEKREPVYCDGKQVGFSDITESRDELRDVPIENGLGHIRFKKPIMQKALKRIFGGPGFYLTLRELQERIRKWPEDTHRVDDQFFSSRDMLDTLKETRGLEFRLPGLKNSGTKAFLQKMHRNFFEYWPEGKLKFEIETGPSGVCWVYDQKLGREAANWEKAYVAAAYNTLLILTEPLIKKGYERSATCLPEAGTHFLVYPREPATKKDKFVTQKDMILHYISPKQYEKRSEKAFSQV